MMQDPLSYSLGGIHRYSWEIEGWKNRGKVILGHFISMSQRTVLYGVILCPCHWHPQHCQRGIIAKDHHCQRGIITKEASSPERHQHQRGIIAKEASWSKRHHCQRYHHQRSIILKEASSPKRHHCQRVIIAKETPSPRKHHPQKGITAKVKHKNHDVINTSCHADCISNYIFHPQTCFMVQIKVPVKIDL